MEESGITVLVVPLMSISVCLQGEASWSGGVSGAMRYKKSKRPTVLRVGLTGLGAGGWPIPITGLELHDPSRRHTSSRLWHGLACEWRWLPSCCWCWAFWWGHTSRALGIDHLGRGSPAAPPRRPLGARPGHDPLVLSFCPSCRSPSPAEVRRCCGLERGAGLLSGRSAQS